MVERFKIPVVVIGDERVGKTSIVMRYCKDAFEDVYLPTLCSDMYLKDVVDAANGKVITLQVWDIGGQEQYKVDKEHYLKKARVIIVVFAVDDVMTFMNLESWVHDARRIAGRDVPVILVGNKTDLRGTIPSCITSDQIAGESRRCQCHASIETSAKLATNVGALFDAVISACNGCPARVASPA